MNDSDKLELGRKRAEELGIECVAASGFKYYYDSNDIHKLLDEGVEAHGGKYCLGGEWSFVGHKSGESSHQALLIGIRPIIQESEERRLLREFIQESVDGIWSTGLLERAKRLLKGEK